MRPYIIFITAQVGRPAWSPNHRCIVGLYSERVPPYLSLNALGEEILIVLSHFQAEKLLGAKIMEARTVSVSPDLGCSMVEVHLESNGVRFHDGQFLTWEDVEHTGDSKVGCFLLEGGELRKIQAFSEATNRPISLMPTEGAPTLLVAGFPMHRIKGIDPLEDTRRKVKALSPVRGVVLDTATGLGYTAIEAARTAERVVTIELDPVVLEIASLNPWSRALFEHPKIEQCIGDSFDVVQSFEDDSFDGILHDPPTFSLAGELYSSAFYREILRVLKPRGRLFHYIGNLESRSGRRTVAGVTRRLKAVGFTSVHRRTEAFGVVARE
jgi:predicted methyltransferase